MKRKEIRKLALEITEGIFSSIIDLILWNIFFMYELGPTRHSRQIHKAEFFANKQLARFNSTIIKRAIYRAKSKGWIKQDLTLTKEGRARLEGFLPNYYVVRKWSGNWYLASYDVPESKRNLRNILRRKLKKLGFGEMHASLWICPFNFLGEIEKIVKDYNLSPYVIMAISDKVGKEESRIFANKIWGLDGLNDCYRELIAKTKIQDPENLIFEYLAILKKDPQLPRELLPESWGGEEAHLVFKKHLFQF